MKTILLLDFNNLFFRMLNVHESLQFYNKHTGGVFGFLQLLTKYINSHNATNVIACMDAKNLWRKKVYSLYKADRKYKNNPEWFAYFSENKKYCKQLLELMNIPMVEVEGYEADDIIANYTFNYLDSEQIVICSNDDDLFQLLHNENVFIQRNKEVVTLEKFTKEYNMSPNDWVLYKAFTGTHNNVKGVFRIRKKLVLEALKNETLMNGLLEKHYELISRNIQLMELTKTNNIKTEIVDHNFSIRKLTNWLISEFDITIKSDMVEAFNKINNKGA